jgi:peptide/nickel transport system substrate-binding protein
VVLGREIDRIVQCGLRVLTNKRLFELFERRGSFLVTKSVKTIVLGLLPTKSRQVNSEGVNGMRNLKNRKLTRLFVLMLVFGMVLSACAAPVAPQAAATEEPAAEAAAGGTITVGLPAGFDRLDPNVTTFSRVGNMTLQMTDPLVWQKEPGVFVPGLATEWSVNEDATEYRFKLREDVKFHDGTPFNAEAVKFTFDRIVDPETQSQSAFSNIGPYKETEIVNDHEVIVRFNTGYAPFLDSLSGSTLVPVSPTAQQRVGNENWGITEFVGTGPFKFESMVLNEEVVMVRNPDYNWGPEWLGKNGPANVEKLIYKFIEEPATRTAALETGEIAFMEEAPEIDFPTLKENPEMVTVELKQPGSGWALMFNQQKAPTDELAVRRAMQLAMDRQGMIDTVFNGFGTPACGPLTSVVFCYDASLCDMYPTNVDEANAVLEEAGWVDSDGDGIREKDGQPLTIAHYYRSDAGNGTAMASFIKDNMAKVGIDVELNGLSRSGYFDAVRAGEHNTQAWWDTGTDPDIVRIFFHSSNAGGGTNRNNYINPDMDRMIDEAAAQPDAAARCALYSDIQKKVKDEAVMEFWLDPVLLYAHSNKLDNVTYYQGGNTPYFYAATIQE